MSLTRALEQLQTLDPEKDFTQAKLHNPKHVARLIEICDALVQGYDSIADAIDEYQRAQLTADEKAFLADAELVNQANAFRKDITLNKNSDEFKLGQMHFEIKKKLEVDNDLARRISEEFLPSNKNDLSTIANISNKLYLMITDIRSWIMRDEKRIFLDEIRKHLKFKLIYNTHLSNMESSTSGICICANEKERLLTAGEATTDERTKKALDKIKEKANKIVNKMLLEQYANKPTQEEEKANITICKMPPEDQYTLILLETKLSEEIQKLENK